MGIFGGIFALVIRPYDFLFKWVSLIRISHQSPSNSHRHTNTTERSSGVSDASSIGRQTSNACPIDFCTTDITSLVQLHSKQTWKVGGPQGSLFGPTLRLGYVPRMQTARGKLRICHGSGRGSDFCDLDPDWAGVTRVGHLRN